MNQFQEIFDKQKAYFDSDATKSYEWRIDQLTRLGNLCNENAEVLEAVMSSDFKTASQESIRDHGSGRHSSLREARFERVDETCRCGGAQGPSGERAYC